MIEDDFLLDEDGILERVDEYTLYCYYLQFEPDIGMKYNSPIRPDINRDDNASFGIFPAKFIPRREYGWKDQATGQHGDIFKLVRLILERSYGSCSRHQMMARVKSDFGLGPTISDNPPLKISQYVPKPRDPMEIRIKSREFDKYDLAFWQQFNVDRELLKQYYVQALKYYWTYSTQTVPRFPSMMGFSYWVQGKYKLYFPHEKKEFKFRNDMTERELEGFTQLKYDSDLLIITKSLKDVMCIRSFGYEAVAPRSETTLIAPEYMTYLTGRYKKILILFDNDGKHKADEYPHDKIWVPKSSGEKDISDFCKRYSPQASAELLKQLTCQYS
jgi:hypothetical protein